MMNGRKIGQTTSLAEAAGLSATRKVAILVGTVAFLAGFGLSATAERSPTFKVPLVIGEAAGLARTGAPVSGGVPLSKGLIKEPSGVKLVDEGRITPETAYYKASDKALFADKCSDPILE